MLLDKFALMAVCCPPTALDFFIHGPECMTSHARIAYETCQALQEFVAQPAEISKTIRVEKF